MQFTDMEEPANWQNKNEGKTLLQGSDFTLEVEVLHSAFTQWSKLTWKESILLTLKEALKLESKMGCDINPSN